MSDDAESIVSPANVHDDAAARCPADRSIMAQAIIEREDRQSVHIDRGGSCLGVWFDSGEWAALASSHLLEHLDEFWTEEWRSRQRQEHERAAGENRLKEDFGPDLYAQLCALADSLRDHPRRSQALAMIRELSSRSRA